MESKGAGDGPTRETSGRPGHWRVVSDADLVLELRKRRGGRERGLSEECRGRFGYNLTSSNLSFLSKLLSIDRRLFFKMTGQTPRLIFLVGET